MKVNNAILGLALIAVASISVALVENVQLAKAESINTKKTTTSCDGSECHTVICINGDCQSSINNGSSAVNKIMQNSTVP